jgi:NitT/TauT family transport system substrate-binding protein
MAMLVRGRGEGARLGALVMFVMLGLGVASCGGGSTNSGAQDTGPVTLRLGYFPNVTHAPAIIGLDKGLFAKELGSNVTIDAKTFNAGPDVVTAIFSDALDISYIGPNPAINAFQRSNGAAIRILAGSTSGGAALVVKPEINSVADLKGKTIATPQLGNTQDVALRAWLKGQGINTTKEGGGEVKIAPQANAQTLETFKAGQIQGGWVPEPWTTRLVLEGGGKVLIDEKSLWPDGKFVTTHIIVRTEFLREHPSAVERFLKGHVAAVDYANDQADAKTVVNAALERLTGKALTTETIDGAWKNLIFNVDPIASSLRKSAKDAESVGLLEPVNLTGIYSLNTINEVLKALGKTAVSS